MANETKTSESWAISKRTITTVIVLSAIAGAYFATHLDATRKAIPVAITRAQAAAPDAQKRPVADTGSAPTIELTETQMETGKVEAAGMREFPIEKEAIGSIDFNQDMAVQVFTD